MERVHYDEFSMFADNAAEFAIPYSGPPAVERVEVEVAPSQRVSALRWGTAPPEVVLLHGGAQNAHTWDTVALALNRPLVAVDLPGHGHSDGSPSGSTNPAGHARDVAVAIAALAPSARLVVGMSLGGLTSILLAASHPELVPQLALVDITPGVNKDKAAHITAFVNGPKSFPSFDELLERTMAHNPTRSEASLRRGILHNAVQLDDGSWVWRYARHRDIPLTQPIEYGDLWEVLGQLRCPVTLIRGMAQGTVVDADDVERFSEVLPSATVIEVEGAGHSIQGDRPVELARILASLLG